MNRKIKIACIGDSIVYGYGVPYNRAEKVWTAVLEELLNGGAVEEAALEEQDGHDHGHHTDEPDYLSELPEYDYEVRNYGRNGQAVLAGAYLPYAQIDSPLYKEMKEWKPDAVFLHVGGNDSHLGFWDEQKFSEAFERLVQDLTALCGREHLCLMAPPEARDAAAAESMLSYGLQNDIFCGYVRPIVCGTAEKYGTDCIDLAALFGAFHEMYEDAPDLYYDEIHPNEAGNELIADAAFAIAGSWRF